jgi:hydroxymethylglutaryl-CoA reductase
MQEQATVNSMKVGFMVVEFEGGRWMEVAEDGMQRQTVVLQVLNHNVSLQLNSNTVRCHSTRNISKELKTE